MFENAEAEYRDLQEKKAIVIRDKEKIKSVIAELDEKKKEALKTTWQKVNKDFSKIFSTLLKGADAKLAPAEGQDGANVDLADLQGLEIKVAFGGLWKDTLSELSGGQKALIALSLILALLIFKPAPMYILDEVDAALDLSHTQNIGEMLRRHFSGSQFLIISHKEAMFDNANAIFHCALVDGSTQVTRTTGRTAASTKSTSGPPAAQRQKTKA